MRAVEPNQEVLDKLGITGKDITAVDISLRPGEFPKARIEMALVNLPPINGHLQRKIVWREVAEVAEVHPAFDLDAECAAALSFVKGQIHRATSIAAIEVMQDFTKLRRDINMRHTVQDFAISLRNGLGGSILQGATGGWVAGTQYHAGGFMPLEPTEVNQ